jgi:hypothetical protein
VWLTHRHRLEQSRRHLAEHRQNARPLHRNREVGGAIEHGPDELGPDEAAGRASLAHWTSARRELARKLRSIGLPLQVLVVANEAGSRQLSGLPQDDGAGSFQVLEIGKIEAALQTVGKTTVSL